MSKNKKIVFETEKTHPGIIYGTLIGAVIGMMLSLLCEIDMGFAYGAAAGMLIGLLFDSNSKDRKKKKIKSQPNKKK